MDSSDLLSSLLLVAKVIKGKIESVLGPRTNWIWIHDREVDLDIELCESIREVL